MVRPARSSSPTASSACRYCATPGYYRFTCQTGGSSLTGSLSLHRFVLFIAVCTFILIIAGGLVTSTQSGLSVPDWPNTYGHFMFAYPLNQMVGGIFYEHSHRMIATFVGFL